MWRVVFREIYVREGYVGSLSRGCVEPGSSLRGEILNDAQRAVHDGRGIDKFVF